MGEVIQLDAGFREVPIKVSRKAYVIRELDAKQYGEFGALVRVQLAGAKDDEVIKNKLLELCLRDENGKAIPPEVLLSWPARVRNALWEQADRLNTEGEVGNVQPATGATSSGSLTALGSSTPTP